MKILFITNYMTHHQLPFCLEMYKLLGNDFVFMETNSMAQERKNMGWDKAVDDYPFITKFQDYVSEKIILDSDIVICGGTHELYIRERMNQGKITFRYFERLYKTGQIKAFIPTSYLRKYKEHTARKNYPIYLLCAGAYVPSDFNLLGAYKNKMLKWGYFTKNSEKTFEEIYSKKSSSENGIIEILWTGRMLDWKHPELALKAIHNLVNMKNDLPEFHLTMIGEGQMRDKAEELVNKWQLEKHVTIKDFLLNDEVLELMEQSDIYLMTSDFNEGWGAVVNEAMDRGMTVIGSAAAGSVPYLIQDGYNGAIFKNGDAEELTNKLATLIKDKNKRYTIGKNAYNVMHELWSAKEAAKRMVCLCEKLYTSSDYSLNKNQINIFENDGPLSKAEVVSLKNGYSHYTK